MPRLRRRAGISVPAPVLWLLASDLVLSLGVCAMFPFLPLYVRQRGGGSVAIAFFVAAPMLANTLVQLPAGRVVDRVGRRPMLLAALAGYAVLAALLAVDRGPLWLLGVIRAGQGVFGGAYHPAMRSAIADLSPPEKRAERFGMAQSAFMVGLLVGPAVGGALAAVSQSLVFVCTSAAAAGAFLLVMLRVPETRHLAVEAEAHRPAPQAAVWWRRRGVLVPLVGLGAMGIVMSMYDVVWPLYLSSRGQGTVVIGFSVTLYAVPLLLLSRRGGRLADRGHRRLLLAANFGVASLTVLSYPFLRSLTPILLIGLVEAVSWVATEPILYAVITDSTPAGVRGRAMAAGGMAEFAGSALGALGLGATWGLGEGIPFWSSSGVLVVAGTICVLMVPARRAGATRVAGGERQPEAEAAEPVVAGAAGS